MRSHWLRKYALVFLLWLVVPTLEAAESGFQVHIDLDANVNPAIDDKLVKVQNEYQRGNLEEALALLKPYQHQESNNADINFYLGLVYKGLLDYQRAEKHLQLSLKVAPENGEAHSHLGELYHSRKQFDLARQELLLARQYHGRKAYSAYLLGLIYLNDKNFNKALALLDESIQLDTSFIQKAEYSKGIAYYRKGDYRHAESAFQTAIDQDPESDAGIYARMSLKKMRKEADTASKPLRASIGLALSYDDNVTLSPSQSLVPVNISNQRDFRQTLTINTAYLLRFSDHWSMDLGYQFNQSFHNQLGQYNVTGNTLTLMPTYKMQSSEIGFQGSIDYYLLDYRKYMQTTGGYLFYRRPYNKKNFGTVRFGIRNSKFFQVPILAAENRSSVATVLDYSHYYFLDKKGAYIALGLSDVRENAKGNNWDNGQQKIDGSFSYPFNEKLKSEIYVGWTHQKFGRQHTLAGIKRADQLYSVSTALSYLLSKPWRISGQLYWSQAQSNISTYSNNRKIYSLSTEYSY